MYIDTHCHLNFKKFGFDCNQVIENALSEEIWMIIVGTNYATSKRAVELAASYNKGVFASVGIHPIHVTKQFVSEEGDSFQTSGENFSEKLFKELTYTSYDQGYVHRDFTDHPKCCGKVVAVGETGLDYAYLQKDNADFVINKQKQVFKDHIKLADDLQLPLIIHARGSDNEPNAVYDDLIDILHKERIAYPSGMRGVIHAFYGTIEQARHFTSMGFLIGIGGHLILKKGMKEVVRQIPLEKIVLETDSPYLNPRTSSENERNMPQNIPLISKVLAELKSVSIYEISQITTHNALELFSIKS